jgi:hypothetical protein
MVMLVTLTKHLSKLTANINEKPSISKKEYDIQFHSQNKKKSTVIDFPKTL